MSRRGIVLKDLIGKEIGDYIVTKDFIQKSSPKGKMSTYWRCICKNGHEEYKTRHSILNSKSHKCKICNPPVRNEKLYHVYHGIIQRCQNNKCPSFKKYGAKGISIADEWLESYENFKRWAFNNGYKDGLTIDRINPDMGYAPENCRWISLSENSGRANIGKHKNKSKLRFMYALSPDGKVIKINNISKFSRDYSLNYSSVSAILHGRNKRNTYSGWTFISDSNESVTTIENIDIQEIVC